MKKVSVLMSIYNENENQIKKSVNSILNQSYKNLELIIIIDNPSNKNEYLKIMKKNFDDNRIKILINEKNIGLALSMNKAFNYSDGYYIARMDADDIAYQKRIENEVESLEKGNYDFVCTGYIFIDEEDNQINGTYKYYQPDELKRALITTNCIHHPTVLMKRENFEKVGGYRNFPCSQDYDLWLRLLEQQCQFIMIDEPLLKYRVREDSTTSRKKFLQAVTLYYISLLFYQRLTNGHDDYSEKNYKMFVDKCNKKYKSYKENINKIQSIQKKLGASRIKDIYYRFILLVKSNFIRDTYLLKIRIKKLIPY